MDADSVGAIRCPTLGLFRYITTGAALPAGADAVVAIEQTSKAGNDVEIKVGVEPGKWVRQVGSDMTVGEVVLEKGCRLGSAEIGLLVCLPPPRYLLVI